MNGEELREYLGPKPHFTDILKIHKDAKIMYCMEHEVVIRDGFTGALEAVIIQDSESSAQLLLEVLKKD